MADKIDFKDTLNLPKTNFPMKANLPEREPLILKGWHDKNLYQMIRKKCAAKPKYILHDGPPYANGHIHMGTALNKILKDIIVKVKTMEGYDSVYVPGWDCHGLPIEHQVDLELGEKKKDVTKVEIRRICRAFASRYIEIQRDEFKRLGVLAEWDKPYLTMTPDYEAAILREFAQFLEDGGAYKGLKPIHWCASCRTALAEAEVEYEERRSPSIIVKFPLKEESAQSLKQLRGRKVSVLIWTTTLWTIPANLAIALHPDFLYSAVEARGELFIAASDLVARVMARAGLSDYKVIGAFKGAELEGLKTRHPLYDRDSPLVLGEYVTLEQGTGCVHTAPGHGLEDYETGLKYGLDIYSPVDDEGRFTEEVHLFGGMNVFEANSAICEELKRRGSLFSAETLQHSYPHCWRCKNALIFRATSQWFISMEKNRLRQRALQKIREVKWIPNWGEERIYLMVQNRPDWCISRQRSWGVPIVAFYCKDCGHTLATKELACYVADLVEQSGVDIWFESDERSLLPPGTRCPGCGGEDFMKEQDILDVWFESGVSHAAVLAKRGDLAWPADLYLEGSDQHRGWFHSSLLTSVGARGDAPYKTVLTHGYVVDGEGKKMSKSAGNVIAPQDVIDKLGAEILRLWVAAENYREDIRISAEILERLAEAYRRIRNTCRFIIGNLYDFDPRRDKTPYEKLHEIDKFILHKLQHLIKKIKEAFDQFDFHIFFHSFHNFCVIDLSSFYLDILKDRLYISRPESPDRRAAQTTLHEILGSMAKLMAPILSFTAEEVWSQLPDGSAREPSVHLAELPQVNEVFVDYELAQRWDQLIEIRTEVLKAIEEARRSKLIGHSLESSLEIYSTGENHALLKSYEKDLPAIFIVSAAAILDSADSSPGLFHSSRIDGLKIKVSKASGSKCERCWMYSTTVGSNPFYPTICQRCSGILSRA